MLAAALSDGYDMGVDGAIVVAGGAHRRFTAGEGKLLSTTATQLGVALRNRRMRESLREAERAQQELDIAASIQLGLLPREQPQFSAGEVAGRCVPAASVGYYDFLVDARGRLAFVIADVAGHADLRAPEIGSCIGRLADCAALAGCRYTECDWRWNMRVCHRRHLSPPPRAAPESE